MGTCFLISAAYRTKLLKLQNRICCILGTYQSAPTKPSQRLIEALGLNWEDLKVNLSIYCREPLIWKDTIKGGDRNNPALDSSKQSFLNS